MSGHDLAISAHGLGKRYRVGQVENAFARMKRLVHRRPQDFIWAVDDLTFDVAAGEPTAVIGRNGAGKSTLLKLLARITEPTAGYADVAGRIGALLEVGTGFHGELTGRENVYMNGALLGMTRADVDAKFDEIVAFAGVERHIDTPVKWYSSGMYVRLGFAVAAHLEPEILIVDEVLAVGDVEFQKRCLDRMAEVTREGRTILFVSHNMNIVRRLCRSAILLERGKLVGEGDTPSVVHQYLASLEAAEGGRRRWEGEERLGDAACSFAELRITGDDDEPRTTFFTSKPIYVTLEFDLEEINPTLMVGFELAASDGSVVFFSSYRDVPDDQVPPPTLGRNALRCEIPSRLLNSGRYMINLRAGLHGTRWIVHQDGVLNFDVIADHGESLFASGAARPGVIAPPISWEAVEPHSPGKEVLRAAG